MCIQVNAGKVLSPSVHESIIRGPPCICGMGEKLLKLAQSRLSDCRFFYLSRILSFRLSILPGYLFTLNSNFKDTNYAASSFVSS